MLQCIRNWSVWKLASCCIAVWLLCASRFLGLLLELLCCALKRDPGCGVWVLLDFVFKTFLFKLGKWNAPTCPEEYSPLIIPKWFVALRSVPAMNYTARADNSSAHCFFSSLMREEREKPSLTCCVFGIPSWWLLLWQLQTKRGVFILVPADLNAVGWLKVNTNLHRYFKICSSVAWFKQMLSCFLFL